jgi:WD40 repeat protein
VFDGGDDNNIHLFSLSGAPSETKVMEGHRGPVISLQYSPKGDKIASGGKDRNVMVWSAAGELEIQGWTFHNAQVGCVAWSPDSKRIASASQDQNLIVWNTEAKTTKKHNCSHHDGHL